MIKIPAFILLLHLISPVTMAQVQQSHFWYFGNGAGMDFNNDTSVALTDGAITTDEGCAVMSDHNGQLLFYTDGQTVYNRSHQIMLNGSGLDGHSSSTQSATIVPIPGSCNRYYIFTLDAKENLMANGLKYSEVDMLANGGLGEVVLSSKNTTLQSELLVEKATVIQHANGIDWWFISHGWSSTAFYAHLITASGIQAPVKTNIGDSHDGVMSGNVTLGQMKASHDGKKLANVRASDGMDIFDFNNANGTLSNHISVWNLSSPYGLEFSPDNKHIYVSQLFNQNIVQFDIEASNINSSLKIVHTADASPGQLQLAPNGKIYLAKWDAGSLDVIHNPNDTGALINYEENGFDLAGKQSKYGLPNFIPSLFTNYLVAGFINTVGCVGDLLEFTDVSSGIPDMWSWDFGNNDTSSLQHPTVIYDQPGAYEIRFIAYSKCFSDTIIKTIDMGIFDSLPADTEICTGEFLWINAGNPGSTYLWSDNSTSQNLSISDSGLYSITITDSIGCNYVDSVLVKVSDCNPLIEMPTAFTPNGDGKNDAIGPLVKSITTYQYRIYNRWGVLLFQTDEIDKKWDGYYKNKLQDNGVYVYEIQASSDTEPEILVQGNLSLVL